MRTSWDYPSKNFIRNLQLEPFAKRQFGVMLDLAGPEFLSPIQALDLGCISKNPCLIVPENNPENYRQAIRILHGLPIDNVLIEQTDIVNLSIPLELEIGILNFDGMKQLRPEDVHFINRLPYQKGAGAIFTFHHPASSRDCSSQFMIDSARIINDQRALMGPKFERIYRAKHLSLTWTKSEMVERTLSRYSFNWGFCVFLLIMFALRNHDFYVEKIITYSDKQPTSLRMISVIIRELQRVRGGASHGPVFLDTSADYRPMLRQLKEFIASSGSTISR